MICCEILKIYEDFDCGKCSERGVLCPDNPFHLNKLKGVRIQDGGTSFITIQFCPFCGTKISDEDPGIRSIELDISRKLL